MRWWHEAAGDEDIAVEHLPHILHVIGYGALLLAALLVLWSGLS